MSPLGKQENDLAYWYRNHTNGKHDLSLEGIVTLKWIKKFPAAAVNKMSVIIML